MKIAFLDRDGTVVRDYPDQDWANIKSPEFLTGSINGMQDLIKNGFEIIIVTNQYLIGEGFITIEQYEAFTEEFLKILEENHIKILDIFFCPHSRKERCCCRKPEIGLIEQAVNKYPDIDLSSSFFCGDSICDMECAENAKIKFYGIHVGSDPISNLSDLADIVSGQR